MSHVAVCKDQEDSFEVDLIYVPDQVDDQVLIELFVILLEVVVDSTGLLLEDQALLDHVLSP